MPDAIQGSPTITRRTLLGSAAAAGATSLLAPAAGLASATGALRPVRSRWLGVLAGESAPILAPAQFALVGLEWSAPAAARIELRAQAPDGSWSRWATASVLGHDGDRQVRSSLFGEPIWTGPAERVQLRTDRTVHGLHLHFVSTSSGALIASHLAAAPPLAQPVLDAGPGQPAIIARNAWAGIRAHPVHSPEYGTVKLAFVHHTETANGYSAAQVPTILRSIYDYHVYVRGFWDIAYNFLIDAYGRIWEGRAGGIDMAVMGAHAGAYNTESTGVAVVGSFMNVIPSQAAIASLEQLLAWKLSLHGIPAYGRVKVKVDPSGAAYARFPAGSHVSLPRVAGHRDGDTTNCPGDAFYHDLPSIRPRIVSLAGTPAQLTIAAPAAPVAPGSVVIVSGQLQLLSGSPLAGAPIELQQLGAHGSPAITIATLNTAADGSWSASVSSEYNMILRALHGSYPAAVADWALVAVAPVLTLQLQSTSPLIVSGTISPAKRRVRVALYRASRTTGRSLAHRRVKAGQGSFTARLPVPGPGTYVVIARSAGNASNAPGISQPLTVTVP